MFIERNWKHQVTDGVLGKTSQKIGHTAMFLQNSRSAQVGKGANGKEHHIQRHRGNSGRSL